MKYGEKYVRDKLNTHSAEDAREFVLSKGSLFDALVEVKQIMLDAIEKDTSLAVDDIKSEIEGLTKKYELVDEVLRDVIKTTEFNMD